MSQSTDKYTKEETLIAELRDIQTRDSAFAFLVQAYQERLYWHLRKMLQDHAESDDALQNTFVKAWKHIGNFRADSKLFTWLYRIATNEALAILKKRKRRATESLYGDAVSEEVRQLEGHVDTQEGHEIERKLMEALDALPGKQRLVFQLKYFEEMKYEEMSVVLDTSVGALKASYHHAVKKIEKHVLMN